jgi:hypothetical protein
VSVYRKIVEVEPGTRFTLVTLDCGHVRECNQTMSYRVGDEQRCSGCAPHAFWASEGFGDVCRLCGKDEYAHDEKGGAL